MKICRYNRFLLAVSLIVAGLSSCKEKYTPGEAENENSWGVYFETEEIDYTMGADSPENLTVKVLRTRTDGEVTVPLALSSSSENLFSAPGSVTFADGEKEKEITVSLSGVEYNVEYTAYIDIPVDPQYMSLYNTENAVSVKIAVIKEDYKPFAEGTYTSGMFTADDAGTPYTVDLTLEYSEMLKTYRLKDIYYEGYGISFTWDGGAVAKPTGSFETGYIYGDYGMTTISCTAIKYDSEKKTFTFPWTWTVTEGTVATANDYYQISKEL